MSGFMQQITDGDHARCLPGEIGGKCGSATSERTDHRIQFPAAIRQIHVGNSKVRAAEHCYRGKQEAVLAVPKAVLAGCFRQI